MPRLTRRFVVIAVLVAALIGTAAVAAAAASRHFGYKKIREGVPTAVKHFKLHSTDLRAGQPIPQQFWGCNGPGVSPELSWSDAPAGTRSFVVTIFDVDAPTGSGFWHWVAWDLPAGTHELPTGAVLPAGAVNGTNDGGGLGYTGPCPPAGDITHHYHVSVVALDVPSLGLPASTRGAVLGFNAGQHAIGEATFTATARQ
jgi:Raf kinase inhibitor-like YbhB/YbcL family protein